MLTGLKAWIFQRISAVYLAIYTIVLFIIFYANNLSYSSWIEIKQNSFFLIATLLAGIFLFIHSWVGIRDIILDYAQGVKIRLICLFLLVIALIAQFIWLVLILFK